MAGQQWNQQHNTNMQFGSNNWNNAATPIHPNSNQGQPQSPEKMIIDAVKYEKVKAFYDYIEGITNPQYKKELDSILLRRMDNARSANIEGGCFVFEVPEEYMYLTGFLNRELSFNWVKHIPNIIARVMKGVKYLNDIGIAYNSIGGDHIMVSKDKKNNINGVKLINLDRTVIFKGYAKSMTNGQIYEDQKELDLMYKAFLKDIKQTAAFINNFFNAYDKILTLNFRTTDPALLPQVELYDAQRESLKNISALMHASQIPFMMSNSILFNDDYNLIATPVIRNN
ncbi:hypothetical protein BDF22DRAFT_653566 [Syncephalis plumigaleata]|nr:hypothetical protein BDF22DRAFT_653566 [Syncephalis plumigaleata]